MNNFLNDKRKNITLIICFVIGIFFVCAFSYSTSILYPWYWGNDSAHFLTVGKAWTLGKIPYRDMFDHKGPLIYFIDMIGYIIGRGDKAGVSIIQAIFMCFTLGGIYQISQIAKKSNLYGFIAVIVSLIAMKVNYVEGNSVEEYCLPFLIWSIYGLLQWYMGERKEHNCKWTILYGITTGVCMMTRVTNVVTICGGVFVICIVLIKQKYFKNLCYNSISFIVGVLIVVFPFVIYFSINGALKDMVYDVLLFNIDYSKGCPPWIKGADGNAIIQFLKDYFVYYIIFLLVFLRGIHRDYTLAMAYLVTGVVETYLFMNGYAWGQYPLICLVQVVLLLNEIIGLMEVKDPVVKIIVFFILFILCTFLYSSVSENCVDAKNIYNTSHNHNEREWERLIAEIPDKDLTQFVVYGGNEFKELYLLSDTMPCYKYYVIQEWISSFTDVVKNDVHDTYMKGNAKWILTDSDTTVIDDVLKNRYSLYDKTDNFKLYKRMNNEKDIVKAMKFRKITNFESYLNEIDKISNITAIISVKDIPGAYLNEKMISALEQIGFKNLNVLMETDYHAFIGVENNKKVMCNHIGGNEYIQDSLNINEKLVSIESACYNVGNIASIKINNKEYSVNQRGFNIVIINNETGNVIDSVGFDTHVETITCVR